VVQENLENIVSKELILHSYKELTKIIDSRLTQLEKQVKDTLHEINENHKNTMGYLVRQVTSPKQETEKNE